MNLNTLATLLAVAGLLTLGACDKPAQQATTSAAPQAAAAAPVAAPAEATQQAAQQPVQQQPQAALAPAAAPATAALQQPQAMAAAQPAAQPAGHPAMAAATPGSTGKPDSLAIRGYVAKLPAAWIPTQPSSSMRVAQFEIPPARGADPGEVAIFYFPPGQGGSHDANIERWTSQFTGPGGLPVVPQTSKNKASDTEITLVELQGTYARGVGMGPAGEARPDQTLMVAMVEAPIGRITLQMYGPNKTVAAQRDSFLKLAKGFRRG